MVDLRKEFKKLIMESGHNINSFALSSNIVSPQTVYRFLYGDIGLRVDVLEDLLFYLGYELAIERMDRHKFDTLVELLIKRDVVAEWLCDEMCDFDIDEDGDSWCARNCKKNRPDEECINKWVDWKIKG